MAQESILFPNDPPQDGDQFTIGNTTYAWDPTPGIWRAFTTASSSSGGGGGALLPWLTQDGGLTTRVEVTGITTRTLDGGTGGRFFLLQAFTSRAGSASTTVEITGTGSWAIVTGGTGSQNNETFAGIGDIRQYVDGETFNVVANAEGQGSNLVSSTVGFYGYIPAGGQVRLFNGTTFFLSGHYWEAADAPSLGGSSTTVNIGGGGGGLALGTFANQVEGPGTSGTLSLDFSGPAWVWLSGGGGGGGARVDMVLDEYAQRGGAAGSGGFFLEDVSVLEGATYTVGARGTGASVTKATNDNEAGTGGGTSTLSWSGITFTCTGGGGGSGSSGTSTAGLPGGTAGQATITGTDAPTLIPQADLLSAAQDAWRNTVVDDGDGNITLAYTEVSFPAAAGGAGQTVMLDQSGIMQETATGAPGGHGTLTIVYQPQ